MPDSSVGRSVSRRTIENAPRNLVELEALMNELDRLRAFAEWVAGYDSERQLVGSGAIAKAEKVLADA